MRRESVLRMLARHTRADGALVIAMVVVVAFVTLAIAILPAIHRDAADESVRAAAGEAGAEAVVSVPLAESDGPARALWTGMGDSTRYVVSKVDAALPAQFEGSVATIVSSPLDAGRIDGVDGYLRLAYIDGGEPTEWVAGRAPGATASAMELIMDRSLEPEVEVGLTAATAQMWGVTVGDALMLVDRDLHPLTARVTGIFEEVARGAELVPNLFEPAVVGGGEARVSGTVLLSEDSLPFARYVLPPRSLDRTLTAHPSIGRISAATAPELMREVRSLATTRDAFEIPGETPTLRTRMDVVLEQALVGVRDSAARVAVVLAGVAVSAALLLVLVARELVDRRARTLALLRSRGAGAPAVGGLLAVESVVAAAVGVALAGLAVSVSGVEPVLSGWVWVPAVVAALAPPIIAMVITTWGGAPIAAGGLGGDRRARRRAVLRVAGEVIVVALAVVGALTLRGRGAEAAADSIAADAPVLAAPALAAVVAGLVAVRLLVPLRRGVVALARRARGAVPLLATARSGIGALGTCAVVVATAMLVVTALSRPGAGQAEGGASSGVDAGLPQTVSEPLAQAESVMSAGSIAALAAMSVLAMVVVGAGARRRRGLSMTRVRVLGMAAGPARRAAVVEAAWPVVVVGVVAVVAGVAIVELVLGGAGVGTGGGVAGWWLYAWPVALGLVAAAVARGPGAGQRRSLGEQMRVS